MAKKSLVKGAAILAVAGLLVKFLGAFFRIPLANWIGDAGMANYSPAYNIYGFLLVFATAGLPVAISRMVAERCAVGQFREAERVFKLSRMLMMMIGVIGFCLLFFFADWIAARVNLPDSALAMRATAPALLLVPLMSSYRGYFQGMQEMTPTALSQVVEQVFRVGCGLALAWILMHSGSTFGTYRTEVLGAAGGCFGASAGAVGGLTVMLLIYFMVRGKIKRRIRNDRTAERESNGTILKKIAAIAIPVTLGSAIMPIVNLIDSGIVMTRLLAAGIDHAAAESMLGQLTGFASPIIAFPEVLLQAIVVSLVPMVSAANRMKNRAELHWNITLGMRMTTIIALPCAAGLFTLAVPVMTLLYPSQAASAAGAGPCMQILSIGFIFLAIITVITGALQGIGKQAFPVINLFIGVLVKFAVTWTLTAVPAINVKGAAIGTACAYLVAAGLDLMALKRFTRIKLSAKQLIVKPLIASVIMGIIVFFVYKGVYLVLSSNSFATLVSILIGVVVYGLMILRIKAITREEMMGIPVGAKLAVICDKLHLW